VRWTKLAVTATGMNFGTKTKDSVKMHPIRVWLQRVINQLAGVKTTALVFGQVELDAGAILAGGGVAGIIFEVWHRR